MGRHNTTKRRRCRDQARRIWHLLPETWRGRVWVWRQRWRGWWDRLHTPDGEWDDSLPKDPAHWSDAWDHIGSYAVAAELRRRRAERGDLLPQRPRTEKP